MMSWTSEVVIPEGATGQLNVTLSGPTYPGVQFDFTNPAVALSYSEDASRFVKSVTAGDEYIVSTSAARNGSSVYVYTIAVYAGDGSNPTTATVTPDAGYAILEASLSVLEA